MKLNFEAKTREQQRIKAYLEENASEVLAQKINNGVRIQKDVKTGTLLRFAASITG